MKDLLIKDLPVHIKKLAMKNKGSDFTEDDLLINSFVWSSSPEGKRFWYEMNTGNFDFYYKDFPELNKQRVKELADQLGVKISFV